jgi:hypothetical protein
VGAGVDLAAAIAGPLELVDIKGDRRRDGKPGRPHAHRDLAAGGGRARHGIFARKLDPLRPDGRKTCLAGGVEQGLHRGQKIHAAEAAYLACTDIAQPAPWRTGPVAQATLRRPRLEPSTELRTPAVG